MNQMIIAQGITAAIVILSFLGGITLLITAIMYWRNRRTISATHLAEAETRKIEAQARLIEAQRTL